MKRRQLITAVGTLAAGSGIAMGTGAFSTVSADRSFAVSTADDSNALLSLSRGDGREASDIITNNTNTNNKTKKFDFGDKVNDEALTTFDGILEIANISSNGTEVDALEFVPLNANGEEITNNTDSGLSPIGVYKTTNTSQAPLESDFTRDEKADNRIEKFPNDNENLEPGESVEVGFIIDTTGGTDLSTIETVRIAAITSETDTTTA